MAIKLTLEEIQILKESLHYSVKKVRESSISTYEQRNSKINELQELKSKLTAMAKEL